MTIAKVISRAWSDADYKAKLLSDPHAALADLGGEVSAGTTIKVVENTADTRYLVLPIAPDSAGELSAEELEKVAGGASGNEFLPDENFIVVWDWTDVKQ